MYCTREQLEDRVTGGVLAGYFIELGADRARVMDGYARRASARIDAMLSARYAVPVASSELLSDICQSLALWQIAADRGSVAGDVPAVFQKPYDEAMGILRKLASGEMSLAGAEAAPGGTAGLQVSAPASRIAPGSPGMEWY